MRGTERRRVRERTERNVLAGVPTRRSQDEREHEGGKRTRRRHHAGAHTGDLVVHDADAQAPDHDESPAPARAAEGKHVTDFVDSEEQNVNCGSYERHGTGRACFTEVEIRTCLDQEERRETGGSEEHTRNGDPALGDRGREDAGNRGTKATRDPEAGAECRQLDETKPQPNRCEPRRPRSVRRDLRVRIQLGDERQRVRARFIGSDTEASYQDRPQLVDRGRRFCEPIEQKTRTLIRGASCAEPVVDKGTARCVAHARR